jgi:Rrf2 family cysteine metabolism transcriptional repressor
MKISLRLEYACRVLTALARREGMAGLSRVEELARLESVPANYLVRILNDLREGGLVESKRGVGGGYMLARQPEDISLRDIAEAVEPDLVCTISTQPGASGPRVAEAFRGISENLAQQLAKVNLRQLVGTDQAQYDI